MNPFYATKLAEIHDNYFSDLSVKAAEEILKLINIEENKPVTLIDLGCGSGVLASILSEKGFNVTGVDISGDMLHLASVKAPKAKFVQASLYDFEFPTCQIITSIGEPLNYIVTSMVDYAKLEKLFTRVFNSLVKNGLFVFDILTNQIPTAPITKIYEKPEFTMNVDIHVNEVSQILERKITIFIKEGNLYHKEVEIHKQYLFEKEKVVQSLTNLGFKVKEIDNYNGLQFRDAHVGFVCRK